MLCPSKSKATNANGSDAYFQQMNAHPAELSKHERALRPWLAAAIALCLSAVSGCERPPEQRGGALKPDQRIISTPIKKPVVIAHPDPIDVSSRPVESPPPSRAAPQVRVERHPKSVPPAAIASRIPIEAGARAVNSIGPESPASSAEGSSIGQTSAVGGLKETTRSEVPARANADVTPTSPGNPASTPAVPIPGPPVSLSPQGDG